MKINFVGMCRITNKLLEYPDDCRIRFTNELLCNCHDQFVQSIQLVDVVEERDDGVYWVRRGP